MSFSKHALREKPKNIDCYALDYKKTKTKPKASATFISGIENDPSNECGRILITVNYIFYRGKNIFDNHKVDL